MGLSHLAIPSLNIAHSIKFYRDVMGCEIGRNTEYYAIINFFGTQLVCHEAKGSQVNAKPTMYPRHFGHIFDNEGSMETEWLKHAGQKHVWEPVFERGYDTLSFHRSFFLIDPSFNLIEFKWYRNKEAIFG